MRLVGYIKSGGRDPQDRMMGLVIGDMVAPLAAIDAFYNDLPGWKRRASELEKGENPLAGPPPAPPRPRDAETLCAALNSAQHRAEAKHPTPDRPTLSPRGASRLARDGAP